MKQRGAKTASARLVRLALAAAVCGGGIAINFAGVSVARLLELPLYLDNIGIILSSVLGGYLSGIFVGFLSNIINGLSDPITYYYGVISVLNAVIAGYLYKKGCFRSLRGIALTITALALSGGGLGSCLTWMLYGGGFGEGISSSLTMAIYYRSGWPPFWSQLCADFLMDLVDKSITMGVCLLVLALIPESWKEHLRLHGWRQAPLTREELSRVKQQSGGVHSFRVAIMWILSAIAGITLIVLTSISFRIFHSSSMDKIEKETENALHLVVSGIDPFSAVKSGDPGEGEEETARWEDAASGALRIYDDIDCLILYTCQNGECEVLYYLDRKEDETIESRGLSEFPPVLTGQEEQPAHRFVESPAGRYLVAEAPVLDAQGDCSAFVVSAVSMSHVGVYDEVYLTKILSLFGAFLILILVAGVWLSDYQLVFPVNSMAMAANAFLYGSDEKMEENNKRFEALDIRTGDEIENLYHTIAKTTADTVKYIEESEKKSEAISRLQNGLILILADMVESRDKTTGNHVKNTSSYAKIIMDQMKEEGTYLDELTEEFMWDVFHSAPLHDIGKIVVPDAILNKPGRLTEEEFAIMKTHTVEGGKIIDRAIEAVSGGEGDASYLKEGRNVAVYHHERWDGTGYPYGLAGTQIPLSARIMSVADVFDALVSKRSYKDAFPLDKAFAIIREGAGTQFDPETAGAFLRAEEKVRTVVFESQDRKNGELYSSQPS